jgi:hypothetical protein
MMTAKTVNSLYRRLGIATTVNGIFVRRPREYHTPAEPLEGVQDAVHVREEKGKKGWHMYSVRLVGS